MNIEKKFQHTICFFLRYLCFALILITLSVYIMEVWTKVSYIELLMKLVMTTIGVIIASVLISAIFVSEEAIDSHIKQK